MKTGKIITSIAGSLGGGGEDHTVAKMTWGAWVVQSVQCLTLGFSAGHDLGVVRSNPALGSALGVESAQDSLSAFPHFPLSLCFSSIIVFFLRMGKQINQEIKFPKVT